MSTAHRTEPTRHLYAGHVYTLACNTDIRATLAAFAPVPAKPAPAPQPVKPPVTLIGYFEDL